MVSTSAVIHVTWEIMTLREAPAPFTPFTAGDSVCDGFFFNITAYGRTVTFEFEDISGSALDTPTAVCRTGSGAFGGNGWTEGRIPIFYRRTGPPSYTAQHPVIPNVARSIGYNQQEMAIAIKDAIDGSPLVSNDSTLVVHALVSNGRSAGGFFERIDQGGIPGPDPAVYLEGVSSIVVPPQGGQGIHDWRMVSQGIAPQPFTRVVNNTIFGRDGDYSATPEPNLEPNDSLPAAIDSRQARQHNPNIYRTNGIIGNTLDFRSDRSRDVDFYQFQLDIGDRVTLDIDAIVNGSSLDSVLRLFNSVGQELVVSRADRSRSLDPFINFTATANDTYYVAVSSLGNETYSPLSLADRVGGVTTGAYSLAIDVSAPRQFVLTARDSTTYPDGGRFQIEDVTGRVVTFEIDTGNGVAGGNFPISINATPIGSPRSRLSTS